MLKSLPCMVDLNAIVLAKGHVGDDGIMSLSHIGRNCS